MAEVLIGEQRLTAPADQPLLDSLQAAGLAWRESCRNGVCGVCACQLISGKVDYRGRELHALDQKERKQGHILPCIAYPKEGQPLVINPPSNLLKMDGLSSL